MDYYHRMVLPPMLGPAPWVSELGEEGGRRWFQDWLRGWLFTPDSVPGGRAATRRSLGVPAGYGLDTVAQLLYAPETLTTAQFGRYLLKAKFADVRAPVLWVQDADAVEDAIHVLDVISTCRRVDVEVSADALHEWLARSEASIHRGTPRVVQRIHVSRLDEVGSDTSGTACEIILDLTGEDACPHGSDDVVMETSGSWLEQHWRSRAHSNHRMMAVRTAACAAVRGARYRIGHPDAEVTLSDLADASSVGTVLHEHAIRVVEAIRREEFVDGIN